MTIDRLLLLFLLVMYLVALPVLFMYRVVARIRRGQPALQIPEPRMPFLVAFVITLAIGLTLLISYIHNAR